MTDLWGDGPPAGSREHQRLQQHMPFHVRGSETSKAAAVSIRPKLGEMQNQVLEFLRSSFNGATDNEIEHSLNMRHQTASARRRELVLLGLVMDSGQRRKTDSGRNAVVWTAKKVIGEG